MAVRREPGKAASPAVVLRGARILDTDTGDIGPPRTVVTRGGSIAEISDSRRSIPDSIEVSVSGLTVLPGLIDAHVHVTQASGDFTEILSWTPSYHAARTAMVRHEMLLRGFTMVRDMGGVDTGLARAVDERLVTGPRLKAGGPIF